MTNEQAIKELQESYDIMRNHDIDESESYLMQALNMAIKALQTQADGEKTCGTCRNEDTYHCAECENKSDWEQAQADGEYISPYLCDMENCTVECPHLYLDEHHIASCRLNDNWQKIKSSMAIPNKVGHWEYNQYDGNPNIGNWHCSECRNIVSDMPTCMGKPLYEFCPNCGCPMEIER